MVEFRFICKSSSSKCTLQSKRKKTFKGDEVLIPAICWSTSLWPIIQNGLIPKFVDVGKDDFNICINDLKKNY